MEEQTVGQRMKAAREFLGFTVDQVAEWCGVTPEQLRKMEADEPQNADELRDALQYSGLGHWLAGASVIGANRG